MTGSLSPPRSATLFSMTLRVKLYNCYLRSSKMNRSQVTKVYFWGGMAERAELANGQLTINLRALLNVSLISNLHEKHIAGAWGNYCMCRNFLLDVCTWRIGQLHFLQRRSVIFLEDSSDNFIKQLWCKKRRFELEKGRFDRKKRPLCFLKI